MALSGAVFAWLLAVGAAAAEPRHVRSGAAADGLASGDASATAADTGFLTVTTDPPAKLGVDGVDTGKTTPVTKLPLSAGKHKVTLTSLDGKTKRTLGVTIVTGEEKRLTVSL